MEKILLGLGMEDAEKLLRDAIKRNNPEHVVFDDVIIHKGREHILQKIKENNPTVVILRESLKGNDDIIQTIYLIRRYFNVRIIFIAKNRKPGDKLLATLVGYSIYDILMGSSIPIEGIAKLVNKPNKIQDVYHLLPKPSDDDYDELIFEGEEKETIDEEDDDEEARIRNPFGIIKRDKGDESEEEEEEDDLDIESILNSAKPIKRQKKETTRLFGKSIEEYKREMEEDEETEQEEQYESVVRIKDTNNNFKEKRKRKKQESSDDNNIGLEDLRGRMKLNPFERKVIVDNRQKILTFFGAKSGIGTTVASFNTAVSLAESGKSVLYIELNDTTPCVPYWYDIKTDNGGLEQAIFGIETGDYEMCSQSIITYNDLINQESNVHSSHLKFPKMLDFLFFSDAYVKGIEKSSVNSNSFKDLLIFLLHQKGYEYIILDVNNNTNSSLIETSLIFSYKNIIVLSQDVASIGYALLYFNRLDKKGLDFNLAKDSDNKEKKFSKNIYLINRYHQKSSLNEKMIRDWINSDTIYVLPENTVEINDTTLNGLPTYMVSRNKNFKNSINYLIKHI